MGKRISVSHLAMVTTAGRPQDSYRNDTISGSDVPQHRRVAGRIAGIQPHGDLIPGVGELCGPLVSGMLASGMDSGRQHVSDLRDQW